MAHGCGEVKRAGSDGMLARVDVGPVREERLNRGAVPALRRHVQPRPVNTNPGVRIRALLEQQFNDLGVPVLRRRVQRGEVLGVPRVDVGAPVHEQ
jgi:hypothetical protein